MLNGDVGRVQGAIAGELCAVQQDGLFGPGRGPLVLFEVGPRERLQSGQLARVVELQPVRVCLARPLGIQAVGADDGLVRGARVAEQGPPAGLAHREQRQHAR
ncbi:hypothetical protein [Streptomyces sp. NPDC048581]|uniref:hypothetical protein n=1 Tax=unclassified Streptomyces TaxID=2593676 RepID=UPI0037238308